MSAPKYNEYQTAPVLTSEGRPWTQRCFVCDKTINFLKTPSHMFVRVANLVRHRKCFPGQAR